MSRQSPSARTSAWLEAQGYTVERVEQRLTRVVTKDFAGFADLLAFKADERGVLAVQATTTSNLAKRVAKVLAEPRHLIWLKAGNPIAVIGWALWDSTAQWEHKHVVVDVDGAWCNGLPYRMPPRKVIIPA